MAGEMRVKSLTRDWHDREFDLSKQDLRRDCNPLGILKFMVKNE